MFNLRSVFAFWVVLALFLGSAERAQAQVTVAIPTTGLQRDHQDYGGKVPLTQINYKDCVNNDVFNFTVTLGAGYATGGYALEVWGGTTCDMQASRVPTTGTCWKVTGVTPNMPNMLVQTSVQGMLYGRTGGRNNGGDVSSGDTGGTGGTGVTGGTGGTDSTTTGGTDATSGGTGGSSGSTSGGSVPPDAPPECTPTSTAVGAQSLTLYFLLIDGSGTVGGQTQWKGTYKLLAPQPPNNVSAKTGENQAPVSWSPTDNQPDQTIDGYQIYCDPAPGQAGLDEAGIIVDPDILPTMCPDSSILVEGARPDDKYKCGTANKTATGGNATGLVNNAAYRVSVASTDSYRNVGVVSTPAACAIPQPVTGFFEAYRGAGGEGGGGFCSFSRHARPVLLFTLLGLGSCLLLRRRRAT